MAILMRRTLMRAGVPILSSLRWTRLFEQFFRVDQWSLCGG